MNRYNEIIAKQEMRKRTEQAFIYIYIYIYIYIDVALACMSTVYFLLIYE